MCNTKKKKLQCSGHIYNHSFDTIKHFTQYGTRWVTQKKTITPADKEYLCLHINKTSYHADQCVKSQILNKTIDFILYIDTFEQQFLVIKGVLQSPHPEDNMKTIGIDQSLC